MGGSLGYGLHKAPFDGLVGAQANGLMVVADGSRGAGNGDQMGRGGHRTYVTTFLLSSLSLREIYSD